MFRLPVVSLGVFVSLLLALAAPATAQATFAVSGQAELEAALSAATPGDTILFATNITLTSELPSILTDLTIDGGGYTLSGNGQVRGLVVGDASGLSMPLPLSVTIQNLTIANTAEAGGAGLPSIDGGGGGGGGLGGAIFVANEASVTLSSIYITHSSALGGGGGGAAGPVGGGEGGSGTGSFGSGGAGHLIAPSAGGYGGGGGGTTLGPAAGSTFAGGTGSTVGGGGGAGLGGAIFVQAGGSLTVIGALAIDGNSVTGGAGATGAADGAAYGSGVFLAGSGSITFAPGAGGVVSVADAIADAEGAAGVMGAGSWGLFKGGDGRLVLSGVNQYSGGTHVQAGTLSVSSNANLGTPGTGVSIQGTSTLGITGSDTFQRPLLLDGTPSVSVAFGVSATWAGSISDANAPSGLIVTGGGTLTLGNGLNPFSNGLAIIGNTTVEFAHDGALGGAGQVVQLGDLSSGGILRLTAGAVASDRRFTLGGTGGIFDVSPGGHLTLDGSITGTGALGKGGLGTLVLSGANGYTGGTQVSAGTLRAGAADVFGAGRMDVESGATLDLDSFDQSVGSLSGAGNITLGSATLTAGTDNSSTTVSGAITGSGALVKTGAGALTLSGVNSYSGGTTVSQGILIGTTTSLQGNIVNEAAVVFDQRATGTYGGVMTGTGSLTKSGSGTLVLTGSNRYSGGTKILGGVMVGTTSSLQGNILNDASLVFDQAANGTYAGVIGGSGAFTKRGAGTLTLERSHTFTGGAAIDAGVLRAGTTNVFGGATAVTVASGATFDLNDFSQTIAALSGGGAINLGSATLTTGGSNASTTLSGGMTGTGSLVKTGAGVLTLLGANTFSGMTTVSGGTLALDGLLASSVEVAAGAIFRANGSVMGTVSLNGTLAVPAGTTSLAAAAGALPGAPPALAIGGDFMAGPGSVLELLAPDRSILIGGGAALDGTLLDARSIELGIQRNLSFRVLSAMGGLTVGNTTVASGNPLLMPSWTQDGTSLVVTMLNLGVPVASAVSPHFASVAGAIDRLKGDMSGDRGVVVRELLALPDDELDEAMRAIAGELHASNRHIVVRSSESFTDLVRGSLTDRDHESEDGQPGWGGRGIRWFGQLSREHAGFDRVGDGALGGGMDLSDAAGGFQLKVSDRFLVGGGGGFGFGTMSIDRPGAGSDFSAPRAFGLVGFKPKSFSIRAGASIGRSTSSTKRTILVIARLPAELGGGPISGGIDREARSEEATVESDVWTEYADHQDLGPYRLDYMFGARRARFARDGFAETGAGALSLRSDGATMSVTDADVKIHLMRRNGGVRPYVETLVRRSSGFRDQVTVAFADDEDIRFRAAGLPMGRNVFASRIGLSFFRRVGTVGFEYRVRKASGQTVQSVDLRFRF